MQSLLKLEIQVICLVHIIAIIISIVFFMMFYMKANKDSAMKAFLILQISMIGWMVFKIFKTISPTETTRWSFIVAYFACACVLEVSFLEFSYAYYKSKPLPVKVRYFIYSLSFVQFLVVFTNPYHHLFYKTYNFASDSFGILFYVHSAIEYGFIIIGFIFCMLMFKEKLVSKSRIYKYLISSAIITPLVLNLLFITKVIHRVAFSIGVPVIFDITPIVFTWSILLFVYATFKHDLLSLSPLMTHEIVHKLDTPICILDSAFEVIYINEKLSNMFDGKPHSRLKEIFNKLQIRHMNYDIPIKESIEFESLHLTVLINSVYSLKETQYVVTIKDITPYKNIELDINNKQMELNDANQKLEHMIKVLKETSKIGARNYVARELHDIMGHSLVVTIKLLEVAKLYFCKNKALSIEAVDNAIVSIDTGIIEMNSIIKTEHPTRIYTGEFLRKELLKMLDHIKNVEVNTNLHFKGILYNLDEKVFDIIKKICTELVTNALKHSSADEVFISVNIRKSIINVLVVDNGIGTDEFTMGNGLKGIEERLKLVNGTAQYSTSCGDGFMSKIVINRS